MQGSGGRGGGRGGEYVEQDAVVCVKELLRSPEPPLETTRTLRDQFPTHNEQLGEPLAECLQTSALCVIFFQTSSVSCAKRYTLTLHGSVVTFENVDGKIGKACVPVRRGLNSGITCRALSCHRKANYAATTILQILIALICIQFRFMLSRIHLLSSTGCLQAHSGHEGVLPVPLGWG